MSIAEPRSRTRRILQFIIGGLLLLVGVLFAAAPAVSAAEAAWWSGFILLAVGAIQLVAVIVDAASTGGYHDQVIPALFWVILGVVLIWMGRDSIADLPLIVTIWLAAYGVLRIIQGVQMQGRRERRAVQSVVLGVLSIAVAAVLGFSAWQEAMSMIGIAVAVGAFVYGFVLIIDAGVRIPVETPLLIQKQDKEIANTYNAEFREFEKELQNKKNKRKDAGTD